MIRSTFLVFLLVFSSIPSWADKQTTVNGASRRRIYEPTACNSRTDGLRGDICVQESDDTIWTCQPTAGGCDTTGEWISSGGGGGTPPPLSLVVFGPGEEHATGDDALCFLLAADYDSLNLTDAYARTHVAGTTGTFDITIRNATDACDVLSTPITVNSAATSADDGVIAGACDDVDTEDYWCVDIDAVNTTEGFGLTLLLTFATP